jgi:hypothetical protein
MINFFGMCIGDKGGLKKRIARRGFTRLQRQGKKQLELETENWEQRVACVFGRVLRLERQG